ncbi:MAG: CDP-alcohol phosphatidyltransferase family protein [Acidobacteria bacterium]|nr:CDP-alcohol phosphatidyltransferase family protein [Acidobacteriota bacterium]
MTIANQLTILRIALVPIFILLVLYDRRGQALAIFVLAGATDLLDGLLARKCNQRTPVGAFLDPLADKMLLTSSFIVLSLVDQDLPVRIPVWLAVTVISRDVVLIISVLVLNLLGERRVFYPSLVGKATTALQLLTILAVLSSQFTHINPSLFNLLVYMTLAFTIVSGVHYLSRGRKLVVS